MMLVLLSKAFGTFPFDKRQKISLLLMIYSFGIVLASAYFSPLYVSQYDFWIHSRKKLVRKILETANTVVHFFVWLSQLKAVLWCDSSVLVFVRGEGIVEPFLTVLAVVVIASLEVIIVGKGKAYLWLSRRLMSVGVTRSVQCLVLRQFIEGVNNIGTQVTSISRTNVDVAISLQKTVIKNAKRLNDFYKVQLLFCTASIFVTLSSESYNVLSRFGKGMRDMHYSTLTEELLWFCYAVYWLLRLVRSCESFYEKMDDLNGRVYNAVQSSQNEKSKEKNQLQIIRQPTFTFSACRFFSIGYTLIASVIGAAATYLVILLDLSS